MGVSGGDFTDSFLTVAEVAELLKLNQQTVRNWIDQGFLPALRVGRRVRIRRSDLERVLEAGATSRESSSITSNAPSAEDFWGGEPVGLAETGAPTQAGDRADIRDPTQAGDRADIRDLAETGDPNSS